MAQELCPSMMAQESVSIHHGTGTHSVAWQLTWVRPHHRCHTTRRGIQGAPFPSLRIGRCAWQTVHPLECFPLQHKTFALSDAVHEFRRGWRLGRRPHEHLPILVRGRRAVFCRLLRFERPHGPWVSLPHHSCSVWCVWCRGGFTREHSVAVNKRARQCLDSVVFHSDAIIPATCDDTTRVHPTPPCAGHTNHHDNQTMLVSHLNCSSLREAPVMPCLCCESNPNATKYT